MSDFDTDEPAIATNDAPPPRNDFADQQQLGGQDDTPRRLTRQRQQTTRAAFEQAFGEQGKFRIKPGDSVDELVPAITDSPVADEPAAAPSAAPPSPSAAGASPETHVLYELQQERARMLDEREAKLAEREKAHKEWADRFKDDPADTVRQLIREAHGLDSDDKVKSYAMDVVSDLTGSVLGLEVPPEARARMATQRAERTIREHNKKLEKMTKDREAEDAKRAAAERDRQEQEGLRSQLEQVKDKYPWLMAEDDPHVLLHKFAAKVLETEPNVQHSWSTIAQRANDLLKSQASAYYGKRKHLLTPEPPQPKQPPQQTSTQDRAPGSRATMTLTNGQAQEPPTGNPAKPMTNEERRRASMKKLVFRD